MDHCGFLETHYRYLSKYYRQKKGDDRVNLVSQCVGKCSQHTFFSSPIGDSPVSSQR